MVIRREGNYFLSNKKNSFFRHFFFVKLQNITLILSSSKEVIAGCQVDPENPKINLVNPENPEFDIIHCPGHPKNSDICL